MPLPFLRCPTREQVENFGRSRFEIRVLPWCHNMVNIYRHGVLSSAQCVTAYKIYKTTRTFTEMSERTALHAQKTRKDPYRVHDSHDMESDSLIFGQRYEYNIICVRFDVLSTTRKEKIRKEDILKIVKNKISVYKGKTRTVEMLYIYI